MKNLKPTAPDFTAHALATGGNVAAIAQRLHVGRRTVYGWIEADEEFAAIVDDARERLVDATEAQMMRLIEGVPVTDETGKLIAWKVRPDTTLIKYHLSTRGRKRGYGGGTTSADPSAVSVTFEPIVPRGRHTPEGAPS